jgi:hypothetical protein
MAGKETLHRSEPSARILPHALVSMCARDAITGPSARIMPITSITILDLGL